MGREEKRILTLFFLVVVRYITDRFQPDKAIDLIDEAAAGLRMQQESRPEELEREQRDLQLFKMEEASLSKEGTSARLTELKNKIAAKESRVRELEEEWNMEKKILQKLKNKKRELADARRELEQAQRAGDLTRAGELKYRIIPSLESDQEVAKTNVVPVCLTAVQEAKTRLLSEAVAEEEIARVVARRTGVAVEAMTQSDRERLRNLEEHLEREVVGQPEAVRAVAACVRRAKVGLNAPGRPLGVFLFAGPTGVGKTQLCKRCV